MGVDYDTEENFPPDDSGYGFDNIGDSLSLSPLLMEKYIQAAETIVAKGGAESFASDSRAAHERQRDSRATTASSERNELSFYEPAKVAGKIKIDAPGDYRIVVEARIDGHWEFDPGRCEVTCNFNGKELFKETYEWRDGLDGPPRSRRSISTPANIRSASSSSRSSRSRRSCTTSITASTRSASKGRSTKRPGCRRRITRASSRTARRRRPGPSATPTPARCSRQFATRAFRRPVDEASVDKLVALAKIVYEQPGKSFRRGHRPGDGRGALVAAVFVPRRRGRPDPAGKDVSARRRVRARLAALLFSLDHDAG